jgi:outer membrane receptor protein involved in Fe transport
MIGSHRFKTALAGGVCAMALATAAAAQDRTFDVPAGDLQAALDSYARQSGVQLLYRVDLVSGVNSKGAQGTLSSDQALAMVLADTGLEIRRHASGAVAIVPAGEGAGDPQSASAAGDGADGTVEALIVTAQKREEDIQDVPIAISAFTQEQLERSQVAGGPDLITQVPNMTFTKTNFTSYSIQIRGIGTQAISATTDAAVAVAFNNTPFIRNRFFEQEFYDLQRVEVLRGPQGTLYGRNATAGVVNLISQKPKFLYEAKVSADVANYSSTRVEGMINVPLVDDVVALRVAGAWTKREGFATNALTGRPIDGRDLWSTRLSLRAAPSDALDFNLIWEHFEEDDDRLRSGKQVCDKDVVTEVTAYMPDGSVLTFPTTMTTPLWVDGVSQIWTGVQGTFSQGCKPSSIYAPESYQTPNGLSLPFVHPLSSIGVPITGGISYFDPYANTAQSTDLRVIESIVEPRYQAESDVVEFQFNADLTDALTLTSETAYSVDTIFSTQDYNRFNTAPGVFEQPNMFYDRRENLLLEGPNGGIFCDPQIGCSDRLVAVDLATARSRQFSEELRLSSTYDGPFNFSLGANFLRYDTEDKYYVFINTVSLYAAKSPYLPGGQGGFNYGHSPYVPGVTDNSECIKFGLVPPDPSQIQTVNGCEYMDPNPIGSLNDRGHNYFLSKNPYKLISYAVFGESYYQITDNLKVTAGLRWTVDKKEAPRIPSWLLAADTVGYPVAEVIEQEWREPTGRFAVDWKPDVPFTDETMIYASYAHGYKAGGMNPPAAGIVCYFGCGGSSELAQKFLEAVHPKTFAPEYIDAFELGSKNTMLDGRLTLNLAGFYYDYTGYQISQIVNRAAVNYNFDSKVWGLEIEADWRPLDNLRLGFKGGYENTEVADGMKAIDTMDRANGGKPDENGISWIVVRPFPTLPSNCILPTWLFVGDTPFFGSPGYVPELVDVGQRGTGAPGGCELAYVLGLDPGTGLAYVPNPTIEDPVVGSLPFHPGYPGWDPSTAPNNGAGISKDLSGNELPNAPHFTATLTADYTVPLPSEWLMTLHTDLYYQSESWARIFNTEGYDKLKAYTNVNLAAIFTNEDAGWKVMAYVKNVFDKANITGSFLNSDDTGLTTNVFMTEPRLYGLRVTKEFTGGPWWTGANPDHTGPYPLTVELGGTVQRQDAPYGTIVAKSFANLSGDLNNIADIQHRDLDWGDGRSIKLTFRPGAGGWKATAGLRYGRTNSATHPDRAEAEEGVMACAVSPSHYFYWLLCNPASPYYNYYNVNQYETLDWSDASARDREEHTIADFTVGRDVGLGSAFSKSTISAGLRYGEFSSESNISADALAGWEIPSGWFKYDVTVAARTFDLEAEREFSGFGPTLTWEAAVPLWDGGAGGRLDVDWSVTAGALMGEQETTFAGLDQTAERAGPAVVAGGSWPFQIEGDPVVFALPGPRSSDVTVPVLDLAVGLSYDAGRVNVGAGYRWERYYDVLDAGYDKEKTFDRTIDGPYFKIAVGFGG